MFNPRDLAKKTRVFPLRAGLITLGLTFAVPVAGPPSSWAAGPTNVSGYILADTTWSLAGSPYRHRERVRLWEHNQPGDPDH
jgi:hypothetical protein